MKPQTHTFHTDTGLTRRLTLGTGARLAFAAPALLAALPVGVASADSGSGHSGSGRSGSGDRGSRDTNTGTHGFVHNTVNAMTHTGTHATHTGTPVPAELAGLQQLFAGKVRRLGRDIAGFDVDPLKSGSLRLFGTNGQASRAFVRLRDANANVTYRLVHVGTDGGTTVLGNVTTDAGGDFRGVLTLATLFTLPLVDGRVAGTFYVQRADSAGTFVNHYVVQRLFS